MKKVGGELRGYMCYLTSKISIYFTLNSIAMKNLILSVAFLICAFMLGQAQSIKYDYNIPILNVVALTEDHQDKEVFVTHVEDSYKITFYVKTAGMVKEHSVGVAYDKNLTSASYIWLSHHRLALRLADADSSDFFDIEVTGKKNWTSLECNVDAER